MRQGPPPCLVWLALLLRLRLLPLLGRSGVFFFVVVVVFVFFFVFFFFGWDGGGHWWTQGPFGGGEGDILEFPFCHEKGWTSVAIRKRRKANFCRRGKKQSLISLLGKPRLLAGFAAGKPKVLGYNLIRFLTQMVPRYAQFAKRAGARIHCPGACFDSRSPLHSIPGAIRCHLAKCQVLLDP